MIPLVALLAAALAAPPSRCVSPRWAETVAGHGAVAAKFASPEHQVVVNPKGAVPDDTVAVWLVGDRKGCEPLPDDAICERQVDGIVCADAAIDGLAAAARRDRPSAALLLVLAHELARVRLGQPTREGLRSAERADLLRQRLAQVPVEDQRERAAAALAVRAFEDALSVPPMRLEQGWDATRAAYREELTRAIDALPRGAALPAKLPGSPGEVAARAEALVCGDAPIAALGAARHHGSVRLARALTVVCDGEPACAAHADRARDAAAWDAALVEAVTARLAGPACPRR